MLLSAAKFNSFEESKNLLYTMSKGLISFEIMTNTDINSFFIYCYRCNIVALKVVIYEDTKKILMTNWLMVAVTLTV